MADDSTRKSSLAAPAKINLGLKILGRRSNGYHELESLFLPVSLQDRLTLEVSASRDAEVELSLLGEPARVAGVPNDGRNLAFRAAERFFAVSQIRARARIELEKRIPAAGGLGGGSSDAAAVLRGLAELFPEALSPDELAGLALDLGADVPFFLDPQPSVVTGVGEGIEKLEGIPELALLLVHPGIPLATAEVYRAYDALSASLTERKPGSTMRAVSRMRGSAWLDSGNREALGNLLENDLEPAAVRLCPPIARLREQFRSIGALVVGLTGSGPTVYGVFEDEASASQARLELNPEAKVWSQVATTVAS